MSTDLVVWLYGFTAFPAPPTPRAMSGVGGAPVRHVVHRELVAFVSRVPAAEFGHEPLRGHLEDLDWLSGTARAHNAVIEAVGARAPVVPARLATLCSDEDRVRELLDQRHEHISATLRMLAGRSEWGVKAYGDRDTLAGQVVGARTTTQPGTGAGAAYLARRRAQLSTEDAVARAGQELAQRIHAELLDVAVAGRQNPPQAPHLSGTRAWMVLNGTYLVDNERAYEFRDAVAALDAEHTGVRLELTGPWPAYSFTEVGQEVPS